MSHATPVRPKRRINWRAAGSAAAVTAVTGIVAFLALGLAAYAAAASYESVSRLAVQRGVPLAALNPVGIDGGLLGVIVLDIALTWVRKPIRWLRYTARLFAAGTVAANVTAGWPDPAGVGLRIAAPVLFIVMVEAGRHVLLHRDDEPAADRIPRIRWLIDFRGTFALWRRMHLWGEKSYTRAVDIELDRISAMEKLSMKYAPGDWEEEAPADLVWMLATGVRMPEALARVAEITALGPVPGNGDGGSDDRKSRYRKPGRKAGSGRGSGNGTRERQPATAEETPVAVSGDGGADEAPDDLDSEAKVLWYLDRGCSASKAGVKAGLTDSRGRQIKRERDKLSRPAPRGIDEGGSP